MVLIIAFLLQFSFPIFPKLFGVTPLMIFPVVVCIAMIDGDLAGSIFGLIAGVLCDINSYNFLCYHAIMFLITGLVCGLLVTHLMQNNLRAAFVLTAGALIFNLFFDWLFNVAFISDGNLFKSLFDFTIPVIFYTMITLIPIYYLMNYVITKHKKKFKRA